MKTNMKDLLKKDDLTYYEAGTVLAEVADMLKEAPAAAIRSIEQAKAGMDSVMDSARELGNKLLEIQAMIDDGERKVYQMYDDTYGRIIKKRREIVEKFNSPMPEIRLPYNIKEFIDAAERLERLSPEAWKRFIDFSLALRGKEVSDGKSTGVGK